MNRRGFFKSAALGAYSWYALPKSGTKHLVFVVMGGVRKSEYLDNARLAPNIRQLAREGFVFEEDHCEHVASHDGAFNELLTGRRFEANSSNYPSIRGYIGESIQLDSLSKIGDVLEHYRPRILICRERTHDIGHESFESYLDAVKATDVAIGRIFAFVKNHPAFARNTAIVIRPEFGRDDEVTADGHLHHSYGFYSSHRVASIFWGPDFRQGIDRKTVISALDMAPTLAGLFGVSAVHAQGDVISALFA